MATAGMTPGFSQQSPRESDNSTWLQRFTQLQRDQLLHDDQIAGTSIAVILTVIFLVGLLLTAGAILMAW